MNTTALIQTLVLCLISIVFEAFGASKKGKKWFENLKQPKYSFPMSVWYLVGGFYYIMCGIIAYRLFSNSDEQHYVVSILLLIGMMFVNGLTNIFLFRMRSVSLFYYSIYPFAVLTAILFFQLLRFDPVSSFVLLPYLIWIFYDFYYFHYLSKMNNEKKSAEG